MSAVEGVSVTVTPPASANFALSLYDPQQHPLAGSSFTAAPGTYFAIISVVSGWGQYSFTLSLIPPDFGISANPTSLNIYQTSSGSSTITLSSIGGYSNAVNRSASSNAVINGVQYLYWSFTGCTSNDCTTSLTEPSNCAATTTIAIFAFSDTPIGTYTVTVTGTDSSGTLIHSTSISVA